MTIIYSNKRVKDLEGCYVAPFRFKTIDKRAKKVYTDIMAIKKAYANICDVFPIKKVVKKVITDDDK